MGPIPYSKKYALVHRMQESTEYGKPFPAYYNKSDMPNVQYMLTVFAGKVNCTREYS